MSFLVDSDLKAPFTDCMTLGMRFLFLFLGDLGSEVNPDGLVDSDLNIHI